MLRGRPPSAARLGRACITGLGTPKDAEFFGVPWAYVRALYKAPVPRRARAPCDQCRRSRLHLVATLAGEQVVTPTAYHEDDSQDEATGARAKREQARQSGCLRILHDRPLDVQGGL